jgi:hypothetical protein
MQKNARGYVQESCTVLSNAKDLLQNALATVERDTNRENIEQSLQAVENALQMANQTASNLEQV